MSTELQFIFSMTQDPRAPADSTAATTLNDHELLGDHHVPADQPRISKLVETLAAHGGGPLSGDLALDIVLNEIVEQARHTTGATGAAIALFRDGELVCRASAGENAPDLGVRVDPNFGLAGACVSTGEIQQCQDTDTDTRVNAEACRRLGVRSMLIAPLVDVQGIIGIIQVFSAWPNVFGKREISALQVIAGRIAESKREAQMGNPMTSVNPESAAESEAAPSSKSQEPDEPPEGKQSAPRRGIDWWGAVLVVLVIATALVLGLLIGWRRAAESAKRTSQVRTITQSTPAPEIPASQAPSAEAASPDSAVSGAGSIKKAPVAGTPVGGLVVTQNGKVIYRSPSGPTESAPNETTRHSLIHKVNPAYPAEAKARHIQGAVVLDVQVLHDGAVGTIAVVSGDPLLTPAAIDAVKQWRYAPDSPASGAGDRQTRVTVNFKLPES